MNFNLNLLKLREKLRELNVDAIIVSMKNSFGNSEEDFSDIRFISGFSGSNGKAIISQDKAILSVDGRYITQAMNQVDNSVWQIEMYPEIDTHSLIKQTLKKGDALAVFSNGISYKSYIAIEKMANASGIKIKSIINETEILENQKKKSECYLKIMNPNDYGDTVFSRINKIKEAVDKNDGIITSDKALIGWAFGIRRSVLAKDKGVLANCIAFISKNRKPILFCDLNIFDKSEDFDICKFEDFEEKIKNFDVENISIDYDTTPSHFVLILQKHGINIKSIDRKSVNFEITKNKTEIENQKKGAELTSLAFIKTLAFAENTANISEKDVVLKFKNELKSFDRVIGFSFHPISAFGPNTAIVHYNPDICGGEVLNDDGLFLFDAGIHFENSTTDMTRTIYIGENPSFEFIHAYSIVLKSIIMFSNSKFPDNTKASTIDSFARYHLWQESFDYHFGTGHGIGVFGNVHEGPRISQGSSDKIKSGMIFTVEPGIYKKDFGVRMENMLLTVNEGASNFLRFETLNHIPFCRKLIDKTLFSSSELSWINNYHNNVYEKFHSVLKDDKVSLDWMKQNTKEL